MESVQVIQGGLQNLLISEQLHFYSRLVCHQMGKQFQDLSEKINIVNPRLVRLENKKDSQSTSHNYFIMLVTFLVFGVIKTYIIA